MSSNEKFYVPVGYPLGYELVDGIPHDTKENFKVYSPKHYKIELYLNDKLSVTVLSLPDELYLWSRLLYLQDKTIRNSCNLDLLESLQKKHVILEAETLTDLLKKLLPLKVQRQGVGWTNEQKICVLLGREMVYTVGLQKAIWNFAMGCKVEDIFNWHFSKTNVSAEEYGKKFASAIIELMKNGLLILQ